MMEYLQLIKQIRGQDAFLRETRVIYLKLKITLQKLILSPTGGIEQRGRAQQWEKELDGKWEQLQKTYGSTRD